VKFLGRIPLDKELMECCENGTPYLAGMHTHDDEEEVQAAIEVRALWAVRS
jgi:hypothetical protein